MKRPIIPSFGNARIAKADHLASDLVTYIVPYAEKYLINAVEGKIVTQYHTNFLYFMEILEITLESEMVIPFKILRRNLFLFYMLEGQVIFENDYGFVFSETNSGQCYATINDEGHYIAKFAPGKHILLYLSLRTSWIHSENRLFPRLQDFIDYHEDQTESVTYMDKIFMNRDMIHALAQLWRIGPIISDDFEQSLTSHVKQLLKAYDKAQDYHLYLLGLSTQEKIKEIANFIRTNFHRKGIADIPMLCERFSITERPFRRTFKTVKSVSPIVFIQETRLAYSTKLLLETQSSVLQIAERTGFSSSNYFCRLFKKKYGYSPEVYRSLFRSN